MKAFITGGAGFIGSCMADRLLLGAANSVTVFDNFSSSETGRLQHIAPSERFKIVRGDLLDLPLLSESIRGHDIVYHFAAGRHVGNEREETSADLEGSVVATHHVLEAARAASVKKIVYLSSSDVYGDCGGRQTGEDYGPMQPVSMYGAGKLGAESFISAYAAQSGITSYIFRLGNVAGARQTHGMAYDFICALRESPLLLKVPGDGTQCNSYIHVDDALNAIFFVMAMVRDRINVFNVTTTDAIPVSWIAESVIKAMRLPNVEIQYTGGVFRCPGDVAAVQLNTSKIRKFGWSPRYNSKEAMLHSIDQMLEHMKRQGI